MAPRPAPIRQADLTRIAKAMRAAGVEAFRIEIDPTGKVAVIAGKSENVAESNDWDAK